MCDLGVCVCGQEQDWPAADKTTRGTRHHTRTGTTTDVCVCVWISVLQVKKTGVCVCEEVLKQFFRRATVMGWVGPSSRSSGQAFPLVPSFNWSIIIAAAAAEDNKTKINDNN